MPDTGFSLINAEDFRLRRFFPFFVTVSFQGMIRISNVGSHANLLFLVILMVLNVRKLRFFFILRVRMFKHEQINSLNRSYVYLKPEVF
ncbi:hypothetical protein KKD49_19645 [Myxococcota bacterium]|nr:hypothetical protein [Myxococcota bacterium]